MVDLTRTAAKAKLRIEFDRSGRFAELHAVYIALRRARMTGEHSPSTTKRSYRVQSRLPQKRATSEAESLTMARIRTIKPDFWSDGKIVELKTWAQPPRIDGIDGA